jgi:hypothetical protein
VIAASTALDSPLAGCRSTLQGEREMTKAMLAIFAAVFTSTLPPLSRAHANDELTTNDQLLSFHWAGELQNG